MVETLFDKEAEQGRYFYCENGRVFKSIRELELALRNCSSQECVHLFNLHTTGNKNDFAAWIRDVFSLYDLAGIVFNIKTPQGLLKELEKYEQELNDKNVFDEMKKEVPENKIREVANQKQAEAQAQKQPEAPALNLNNINDVKEDISKRSDRSDVQFDRVKKLKKHSFYNKADFDESVEDLRNRYDELNQAISDHRKEGKEMSIPAMMLRNILPKINYFQISQNRIDYDNVIDLMDNLEKEIKYSKDQNHKNLKEEILEALGISKDKKEE